MLEVARARKYARPVEFREADAFRPDAVAGEFDALMAGFWMSHVPRAGVPGFLAAWQRRLPGARIVFFDNRFVSGRSTPISRTAASGDTYQMRQLDDGTRHEVIKNFPDDAELRTWMRDSGARPDGAVVRENGFYWFASCTAPA